MPLFEVRSSAVAEFLRYLDRLEASLDRDPMLSSIGLRLDALRIPMKAQPFGPSARIRMEAMPRSLDELAARHEFLVVHGTQGGGKTQWLSAYIKSSAALNRERLDKRLTAFSDSGFPCFLKFRQVCHQLEKEHELESFVSGLRGASLPQTLSPMERIAGAIAKALLDSGSLHPRLVRIVFGRMTQTSPDPSKGKILVGVDGWEETISAQKKDAVYGMRLLSAQGAARFIVTCRTSSNDFPETLQAAPSHPPVGRYVICPLSKGDVRNYVSRFFDFLDRPSLADELLEAFDHKDNLSFLQNPGMLLLSCMGAREGRLKGRLNKASLLEKAFDGLLMKKSGSDEPVRLEERVMRFRVLEQLAVRTFEKPEIKLRVLSDLLKGSFGVDELCSMGILTECAPGNVYTFSHTFYRDFFFAQYFAEKSNQGAWSAVRRSIPKWLAAESYRDAAILLAGLLDAGKTAKYLSMLKASSSHSGARAILRGIRKDYGLVSADRLRDVRKRRIRNIGRGLLAALFLFILGWVGFHSGRVQVFLAERELDRIYSGSNAEIVKESHLFHLFLNGRLQEAMEVAARLSDSRSLYDVLTEIISSTSSRADLTELSGIWASVLQAGAALDERARIQFNLFVGRRAVKKKMSDIANSAAKTAILLSESRLDGPYSDCSDFSHLIQSMELALSVGDTLMARRALEKGFFAVEINPYDEPMLCPSIMAIGAALFKEEERMIRAIRKGNGKTTEDWYDREEWRTAIWAARASVELDDSGMTARGFTEVFRMIDEKFGVERNIYISLSALTAAASRLGNDFLREETLRKVLENSNSLTFFRKLNIIAEIVVSAASNGQLDLADSLWERGFVEITNSGARFSYNVERMYGLEKFIRAAAELHANSTTLHKFERAQAYISLIEDSEGKFMLLAHFALAASKAGFHSLSEAALANAFDLFFEFPDSWAVSDQFGKLVQWGVENGKDAVVRNGLERLSRKSLKTGIEINHHRNLAILRGISMARYSGYPDSLITEFMKEVPTLSISPQMRFELLAEITSFFLNSGNTSTADSAFRMAIHSFELDIGGETSIDVSILESSLHHLCRLASTFPDMHKPSLLKRMEGIFPALFRESMQGILVSYLAEEWAALGEWSKAREIAMKPESEWARSGALIRIIAALEPPMTDTSSRIELTESEDFYLVDNCLMRDYMCQLSEAY